MNLLSVLVAPRGAVAPTRRQSRASIQATTLDLLWIQDGVVCFAGARKDAPLFRAVLALEGPAHTPRALAASDGGALAGYRALLGHLDHTVGADAVFASIAAAAALHPEGGALLEWRGAAACAHGRLRPDGYGLVRLGQRQHGFFLEFDRGTMRPHQLRAKFNAYHRYRRDARAATSFAGFPTLLVVTTGTGAEERLARRFDHASQQRGADG